MLGWRCVKRRSSNSRLGHTMNKEDWRDLCPFLALFTGTMVLYAVILTSIR
jgi:hypothetical protein